MPPEVTERVTDAGDLTESDELILGELQEGARTKGALVDATELHRNTVGHRLDILEASGVVELVHDTTALYELVDDPRVESVDDEADLRATLQDDLEARDDQRARADRLEGELDDCQELLDGAREAAVDVDLQKLDECLQRALSELPDEAPGRTSVEDAHRIVEGAMDDE